MIPDDATEASLRRGTLSVSHPDLPAGRSPAPCLDIDPALPIAAHAKEIVAHLARHRVLIVSGDPGSGKTTQLPKLCLARWPGETRRIGHTQPRRLAARSVAARVAEETGTRLGDLVGYQVRFDRRAGRRCRCKLMSDGILLAEIQADPDLAEYHVLIIDEAHERSLNIDVLLGHLKRLLRRRDDLRVVISSATIDTRSFSTFFDAAPVVEVSGRRHPVALRYRPPPEGDVQAGLECAIEELYREETEGDVLVFLASEREIRESARVLRRLRLPRTRVLPLYARLPLRDQLRVFEPSAERRIVLATNVAETSLTVPGIRCVIDSGFARISRHRHRHAVQRLPVERVSRASADQRMGRCGRLGPGVCIRLYSAEDFEARPRFIEPEILRSDLAALLLRLKEIDVEDLQEFPFLDRPDRRHVNDGERLLRELGALEGRALTATGRILARMPVDPRTGRMLIEAATLGVLDPVLVIASALSVADPFERPSGAEGAASGAPGRLRNQRSDFMGLLGLWQAFHKHTGGRGSSFTRRYCRRHGLSFAAMREWQDVHDQLRHAARDAGLPGERKAPTYGRVHRALLAGLLRNVGVRGDRYEYSGLRDLRFRISPGSALFARRPRWVVAADLVETERLYAHRVAEIRPEWVERSGRALLRRTHFDAHWDAARAEAMVCEQTALYGLTLSSGRRVRFAPISRPEARALFIRAGLVEGRFESAAECLSHNRAVIAGLRLFDHKHRRPDVVIRDQDLFDFYHRHLPESVCDGRSFGAWWQRAPVDERERLMMRATTLGRAPPEDTERDYPDYWCLEDARLALSYRFSPGDDADGIGVSIPRPLLGRLDPGDFEWLVPGRLEEKVLAMLRALPKGLRRELMPLPQVAARFVRRRGEGGGSLVRALLHHLWRHEGVQVAERHLSAGRLVRELPPHLLMRFSILDDPGRILAAGRDLARLQREFGAPPASRSAGVPAAARFERRRLTRWCFGDLPEGYELEQGGARWHAYPALVDRGDAVDLSLAETRDRADALTRRGLLRLLMLRAAPLLKRLRRHLPGLDRMALAHALVREASPEAAAVLHLPEEAFRRAPPALAEDLIETVCARAFLGPAPAVRSRNDFERVYRRGEDRLGEAVREVCALCERILDRYREVLACRNRGALPSLNAADVDCQIEHLVFRGFMSATDWSALCEVPRYLEALLLRLQKLRRGGSGDDRKVAEIAPLWRRFAERAREHHARGRRDPELARYRWMLEEFRVSLFAQEIGAACRISRKRLDEQWQKVAS